MPLRVQADFHPAQANLDKRLRYFFGNYVKLRINPPQPPFREEIVPLL